MIENRAHNPNSDIAHQESLYAGPSPKKIPRRILLSATTNSILPKLKKMDIAFEVSKRIIPIARTSLLTTMKSICKIMNVHRWRKADEVNLCFENIPNSSLKMYGLGFWGRLPDQQQLDLLLSERVKDQELELLATMIARHLPHLRKLNLDLSNCNLITKTGVQILSKELGASLIKLKQLSFTLKKSSQMTKLHLGRHLRLLKHLSLDFKECNSTDNELSILINNIRKIKLQSLTLNLTKCVNLTDSGIQILASDITRHFGQLQKLNINLNMCPQISDDALKSFGSEICRHMPELRHLTLSFGNCDRVTDEGITALTSDITGHMSQLSHLGLEFHDNKHAQSPNISAEGMTTLINQIARKFPQLKGLNLAFRECKDATDKIMEIFSSEIKTHLTQLRSLSLSFQGCKFITDDGFKVLISGLGQHLTQLRELNLNFSDCIKISDKGLEMLGLEITEHLTKISQLSLQFRYCYLITEKGVGKLTENFPIYLRQLLQLNLNFWGLSKSFGNYLRELFSFVPSLTF